MQSALKRLSSPTAPDNGPHVHRRIYFAQDHLAANPALPQQYDMEVALKRFVQLAALLGCIVAASPSLAQSGRSVALVLDASGSMNAKLPDGQTRIDAAKKAVADLVSRMDPNTRLALRAYGHQSPTQKKDCKDTALLVGFAPLASNRAEVIAQAQALQARGYTPITHALTAAAHDIASEESGERIVVLVSDGQETCAQRSLRRGAGVGCGRCQARHPHHRFRRRRGGAHAVAVHRQRRARELFRRQQHGGPYVDARQGGADQGRRAEEDQHHRDASPRKRPAAS